MKKRIQGFLQVMSLLWLLLLAAAPVKAQTPVAKNGQLRVIGLKLCNQYGNPIQLRGMSTHGIQWYGWNSCLTEASLDALANDWGADILRISLYVQEGGYDTDPTGFTNQVSRLIDEATERGMYALVDWHQLDPGDPNDNLAKAKTFFTAIANAHKNKNNIIYDVCNEPNGVTWARIKTYADQIIPVIRAIDADAPIFIGTHGWASFGVSDGRSAQDIVSNPLGFSNIMYTFHFYAASHGQEYLDELNWASDRLPVFVTEFGTQTASGDGSNNFTRSQQYIDLMRTKKIGWANWNYSDDSRSGAVWNVGTCSGGPWTVANLKPAGAWIRDRMRTPADDFPGGGTPTCEPVTASADDGNVAANVLDNNLATRWSANGDGQWIQFCLSGTMNVTGVQIAFYNGNTRTSSFDVLVGNDGATWTTASAGRVSNGTSTNLETFSFTPRDAKYVRIVGHGNSVNLWNSYTEVKILTGSTGQQFTLAPQHDAYVRNGTYAAITHGTTDPAILISKLNSNPATGNDRHTYLRFDAAGVSGAISSAVLRVYGKLDDNRNSNIPVNCHSVSNTTWTESAITWNNKPATGSSLVSATVTDSIGRYYTWDITAYVAAEKAAGRNGISLALLSTVVTSPRITWNSKETGSNPPQLVITTASSLNAGTLVQNGLAGEDEAASAVMLKSFPNPFRESNTISFYLEKGGFANLTVFDLLGRQVAVLVNGNLPAGQHRAIFKPVGTGPAVYTIRLVHDRKVVTRKLVRE